MLKKVTPVFLLLLIVLGLLATLQPSYAQESTPATALAPTTAVTATTGPTLTPLPLPTSTPDKLATNPPPTDPANEATFARLGSPETTLYGPFDAFTVFYNLPANWALQDGAMLVLDLSSFFNGAGGVDPLAQNTLSGANVFTGSVAVVYNDQTIATLALQGNGD